MILLLLIPLLASIFTWLFPNRVVQFASLIFLMHLCLATYVATGVFLEGPQAISVGLWKAPYGIILISDDLSAALLTVASLLFFCCTLGQPLGEKKALLPLLFLLQTGVSLSFLTGDLFNLFVAFELMLMASYGLFVLMVKKPDDKALFHYFCINILASLFFLISVSIFYGAIGSLNFAALSTHLSQANSPVVLVPFASIALVLAIKSGLFPLYFWLPDSYPKLPGYLGALLGGTLSKVGLYVLLRLYFTVFNAELLFVKEVLIFLGSLTMFFGVLGAVSKSGVREILSYHILSQIGYIVFSFAIGTTLAVASAIFFLIHNMIVKSSLFLIGGIAEKKCGSDQLEKMGGLWKSTPFLGWLFLFQALSLAGLPPLSGFWGKYMIFYEGLNQNYYLSIAVATVVSFLTIYSMLKIWNQAFLIPSENCKELKIRRQYIGPTILTAVALSIGIGIAPVFSLTERTAKSLVERSAYISASLQTGSKGE